MQEEQLFYRVLFLQQNKLYEIYARYISEESLMGFIEVEDLVFTESMSNVAIDPAEEKLEVEFKGVKRFYIPMHALVRIDEVIKEGPARIKEVIIEKSSNISPFPGKSSRDPEEP